LPGSKAREITTEIETMSGKLLPALIGGLLLGTTALASAQTLAPAPTKTFQPELLMPVIERGVPPAYYYAPYYGTDPYGGTPFENVAPYSAYGQPDPYAGTVMDGVAPY
jgi:hypothetical protein